MSLLAPLYALGLLAIAAPIVFHLIRRTPRSEVPFSSLMFLSPTPPRLTRRSRLDQVLLLLLRAAALALLALAFTRPFLREASPLDTGGGPSRRIAVLIDASASMRRGGLWAKAKALAGEAVASASPGDQVAVYAFDATSKPVLGFAESAGLDPSRRLAVARARLATLEPGWGSTNLGQALVDAVAAFEDLADASEKTGRAPRRVVLVSDLQQGSRLDALGEFEWPSDVELELRTVESESANAGVQWLVDPNEPDPAEADRAPRVRVSNDPGAARESFTLSWVDSKGAAAGAPIAVYVPPGESRVVRVPRPGGPVPPPALRLEGDAHPFDDTIHRASTAREELTVFFVGDDPADDPSGLLYYLQRVFAETAERTVTVVPRPAGSTLPAPEPGRRVPLIVVAGETSAANVERLQTFARSGGTVLLVLRAPGRSATLGALAGIDPPEVGESEPGRDVLLAEVAFDHPLFAALAGPQFNDFTKIRFWKHRRLDPEGVGDGRVLARFEGGEPAIVEQTRGPGRLVVLASGWNPSDSQLARSSKFVPLMTSLLEGRGPKRLDTAVHLVNEPVPLPSPTTPTATTDGPAKPWVVHKPDGTTATLDAGAETFTATDRPGLYTLDTPSGPRSFAVNLDPAESATAPLSVETLEQFGCRLARPSAAILDPDQVRQMRNTELEGRQKLWRWVILAAIGVLMLETLLAGRLDRARPGRAEGPST